MRTHAVTSGDHGPEFEGQLLDAWAYKRCVRLSFIRPGNPKENAHIESFNGKFRDDCLNERWFVTMVQAMAPMGESSWRPTGGWGIWHLPIASALLSTTTSYFSMS